MSKPTILLVHGANLQPAHFEFLEKELQTCGYKVVAPALPSITDEPAVPNMDRDTAVVRSAIEDWIDESDVVIFAHSYGGMPASCAVKGLDKSSRQKAGHKHGVTGIVFLSATLPAEGANLMSVRPQSEKDSKQAGKNIKDGFLMYTSEQVAAYMCNRQTQEIKDWMFPLLRHWSVGPATAPMTFEPWNHGIRCAYIWGENDVVQSNEIQEYFTKGRGMDVLKWDADHCAIFDRPAGVAKMIRWYAGEEGLDVGNVYKS